MRFPRLQQHKGWQNRSRISLLIRKLIESLLRSASNDLKPKTHLNLKNTQTADIASNVSDPLLHLTLPFKLKNTSLLESKYDLNVYNTGSIIFTSDAYAFSHLSKIFAFLSFKSLETYGFQFHFNDRESISAQCNFHDKEISFFINNVNEERVSALNVMWSDQTDAVDANVCFNYQSTLIYSFYNIFELIFTQFVINNERCSQFITTDLLNDFKVIRHVIPPNGFVTGMFGHISIQHQIFLFFKSGLIHA